MDPEILKRIIIKITNNLLMSKIALVGAGGKMGCRLTDNFLKCPQYVLHYLEVSEKGIQHLKERNITVSNEETAIKDADVVILAVPDVSIGAISNKIVPQMKPGALVLTLDPAAPLDGVIHHRDDLGYVIAHPCHPSVFNWEPTEAAFRDFYGGISAKQSIVVALMFGNEEHYSLGEKVAQDMYGPIDKTYRITLEQMAILEPAMVETLAQTCMEVVKEGYDRIVELGVPEAAARDFVLGHLRIQMAVLFKEVNGSFSDAAYKISKRAKPILFKENWKQIFEMDDIKKQVRDITNK
jgi:ketol-acid reductoisomerase